MTDVTLTPKAAKAIQRFIRFSETPVAGMRIEVQGGGCSGYQYSLKLEKERQAGDAELVVDGVPLFIDPASQTMIEGLKIDFVDSITETGFKFDNPNTTVACGCGKSFSF